MTDEPASCSRCQFWLQVPDQDGHQLGQCRRFPPSYEGWAMAFGHDWCGEFAGERGGRCELIDP